MRDRKTLEEISRARLQQGESTEGIAIELLLDLREQNDILIDHNVNLFAIFARLENLMAAQIEIERDAVLQAGGIRIAGA